MTTCFLHDYIEPCAICQNEKKMKLDSRQRIERALLCLENAIEEAQRNFDLASVSFEELKSALEKIT